MTTRRTRVLIVDDSELIRNLLTELLMQDDGIDVVGTAADPYEAREMIKALEPDVITLDIEMPRMDGLTFLRNLMRLRPMPVVMISTLTERGSEIALEALAVGAVDYVEKPKAHERAMLPALAREICTKVRAAARANIGAFDLSHSRPAAPRLASEPLAKPVVDVIAIGASTGGTEAIKRVLSALPRGLPPILIVQHMPEGFTSSFAKRLDATSGQHVQEFDQHELALRASHVYLAKGGVHMLLRKRGGVLYAIADDGPSVNRHKPAVDCLFDSVAESCGARAIGVLLTGMGQDGARGLGHMRAAGAHTLAQDEQSSVVWGMPRVAIEEGAAEEVASLRDMGNRILHYAFAH